MPASRPVTNLKASQMIAGALLMSTIVYSILGVALLELGAIPKEGMARMPADEAKNINTFLTLTGLLSVASSIPIRKALDANVPKGEAAFPARFRNVVVAMALSEGAGVAGFIMVLLTGSLAIPMILWGAAAGGCILHFPTQRLIADSSDDRQ